jgi:hypothetical protein
METFLSKSNNVFHENENFTNEYYFLGWAHLVWNFACMKKICFNLQNRYLVEHLCSYTTTHQLQELAKWWNPANFYKAKAPNGMWEQGTKGKDQRPSQKIKILDRGAKKEEEKKSCTQPSFTRSMSKKEKGGTLEEHISRKTLTNNNGPSRNKCNMHPLQHHWHPLLIKCTQNQKRRAFEALHRPCHINTMMNKIVGLLM